MTRTEARRPRPLRIGELAARTGIQVETIRYCERIGISPRPLRGPTGYRQYAAGDVARLRFIRRARELGFSLDGVAALLKLSEDRPNSCAEVAALVRDHLRGVRTRLDDLRRMEQVLAETLAQCAEGHLPNCPMIETLSAGVPGH